MKEINEITVYFSLFITLFVFYSAIKIKDKCNMSIFNPLLVSIIVMIIFLKISGMPTELYSRNTEILMYLLTPATICLALPLYQNLYLLRQYWKALLAGISAGVISNLIIIYLLAKAFSLSYKEFVTILPKSITSAISLAISEELGGNVTVTILVVVITGVMGNVLADGIFYRMKLKNKMAKGVALGTSAHVIGTSKALEYGEAEGGMASLAIVISGILTVIIISIFTRFY